MQEILVLSGKGGTGKTSLASSLIALNQDCIACDYDVDASNLPLLLHPQLNEETAFSSSQCAVIDIEQCIECGLCEEHCRFDAIQEFQVDTMACEGCALCFHLCPVEAVHMKARSSGKWMQGNTSRGPVLYYAELQPGEENSGKLVAEVKEAAHAHARQSKHPLIIADGPPGIGCAVISSLVGVSLAVLVTEPSVSGFSDLQRLRELLSLRSVPAVLIINKWDLNPDLSKTMQEWAEQHKIPFIGKIPFSRQIADHLANGEIPAEQDDLYPLFLELWEKIRHNVQAPPSPEGMHIEL